MSPNQSSKALAPQKLSLLQGRQVKATLDKVRCVKVQPQNWIPKQSIYKDYQSQPKLPLGNNKAEEQPEGDVKLTFLKLNKSFTMK